MEALWCYGKFGSVYRKRQAQRIVRQWHKAKMLIEAGGRVILCVHEYQRYTHIVGDANNSL